MLSGRPPYQGYEHDLNRVCETFRKPTEARVVLKAAVIKKRLVGLEELSRVVLEVLGEDQRSWRDWKGVVVAAAKLVVREETGKNARQS